MIQVENISKRYGKRIAVEDLSFSVEKGKIYGFLGPNGAGKSTTMNIMTGYTAASSGTVKINGFDILKDAKKAKQCIGYLPEIPPLYADMINAITQDRQPYVTAMDGKRALELVLAIYKSAAEGCKVKFPLEECATMDFAGRFPDAEKSRK